MECLDFKADPALLENPGFSWILTLPPSFLFLSIFFGVSFIEETFELGYIVKLFETLLAISAPPLYMDVVWHLAVAAAPSIVLLLLCWSRSLSILYFTSFSRV